MADFDERFAPLADITNMPSGERMRASLLARLQAENFNRLGGQKSLPEIGAPPVAVPESWERWRKAHVPYPEGHPLANKVADIGSEIGYALAVPQTPSDYAMMAFGPLGRLGKLAQLGALAGGFALDSDEAQAGGGGVVKKALAPLRELISAGDTRVSTRFPTAVKREENPLTQHLSIGLDEMKLDPENFAHNTAILSRYPGFARLQGMSPDEAAQAYIDQAKGNLQYLYERSPAEMRLRSPRWYEGAHEISQALADRWGVPRQSVSAAMAALSPQKDWFMNASLGERVGDIVMNDPRATGDMLSWIKSQPKIMAAKPEAARAFEGQRLSQVNPQDAALFVRAYDEAHNPRAYRSILPEGYFGDFVTTQAGEPSKVAWGTFGDIEKARRAIQSGGDVNLISPLLGERHKVRSFYNNIEVPFDTRFGDITADTHQVAAAQMRPLSGASEAVIQHLASGGPAGSVNARSSALTGVQGTYGLVADATRQAAAEAGMLPRAMQSATWEPIRELFPAKWKTATNAAAVDDIWKAYDRGDISIDQARDTIFNLAGGIGSPEWARAGIGASAPQLGSTYR